MSEHIDDSGNFRMILPNAIKEDSWLREERFRWFVEGYEYAMSQSRAIPTLAKISPEGLYFAVSAVLRGARRAGVEVPEQ